MFSTPRHHSCAQRLRQRLRERQRQRLRQRLRLRLRQRLRQRLRAVWRAVAWVAGAVGRRCGRRQSLVAPSRSVNAMYPTVNREHVLRLASWRAVASGGQGEAFL